MSAGAVAPSRALAALAAYLAGIVLVAGALSPWMLGALRAAGAESATLVEVAVRTLQLVAIAATFALLVVLGGPGRGGWRAAWGIPPRGRRRFAFCACPFLFGLTGGLERLSEKPGTARSTRQEGGGSVLGPAPSTENCRC